MPSFSDSPILTWFDRKFDFTFPAGLLPNICARLRGTPARLDELLAKRDESLLQANVDKKWSIKENVGHLIDLEALWLSRVADFAAGRDQLTPTDLQNRQTDEAAYNGVDIAVLLDRFRSHRDKLLRTVHETEGPAFERLIAHPRLRVPIRLVDHLYFVAEHDDHHLARIWTLLGGVQSGR